MYICQSVHTKLPIGILTAATDSDGMTDKTIVKNIPAGDK